MALFMRNKMITLCPTTYELAQKMPNFSSWVRMKLMEMHFDNTHVLLEDVKPIESPCPNCENSGDHYCKPLQMFVKGWSE